MTIREASTKLVDTPIRDMWDIISPFIYGYFFVYGILFLVVLGFIIYVFTRIMSGHREMRMNRKIRQYTEARRKAGRNDW